MNERIDAGALASGLVLLLVGTAIIMLDLRLGAVDVLLDPAGQVMVAVGVAKIVHGSPRTPVGDAAAVLAVLAVLLSVVLEVAVMSGRAAVGTVPLSTGGTVVGTTLLVVQDLGVIVLAQHLRRVLDGIAADRWRQVTIAFVVSLVLTPLVAMTQSLELLLLQGAVVIVAGVLFLLSALATRALALDAVAGAGSPEPPN